MTEAVYAGVGFDTTRTIASMSPYTEATITVRKDLSNIITAIVDFDDLMFEILRNLYIVLKYLGTYGT